MIDIFDKVTFIIKQSHSNFFGLLRDEKILLPLIDPTLFPGLDHHLLKVKNIYVY